MELASLQPHVKAADLPLDRLAASTQVSEADKLGEVSRQFEAVLLRQILSSAQKPLLDAKAGSPSATAGIYQDMITTQLADKISHSGGIGLATSLAQQLGHQFHTAQPPARPRAAQP